MANRDGTNDLRAVLKLTAACRIHSCDKDSENKRDKEARELISDMVNWCDYLGYHHIQYQYFMLHHIQYHHDCGYGWYDQYTPNRCVRSI